MARLLLVLLAFSSFLITRTSAVDCYSLLGEKLDDTYGPCKTNGSVSGCCAIRRPPGSVDICLDSGACMGTNGGFMGTIWMDGCTDPTGQDPACPHYCPDASTNWSGYNKVKAWNIQTCDYGSYCCRPVDDDANCCNNATAPHFKANGLGAFQFETSTAGKAVSATPLSTTASANNAATTNPASSRTTEIGSRSTTGASASQTRASGEISDSLTCPKDMSAVVGGAVGGTLGTACLALLGALAYVLRKNKSKAPQKYLHEVDATPIVEMDGREMPKEMDGGSAWR